MRVGPAVGQRRGGLLSGGAVGWWQRLREADLTPPTPHRQPRDARTGYGHLPVATWLEAHFRLLQPDSLDRVVVPLNKF